MYKYCEFYSGKKPTFLEDDIFKIIVPLDNSYSYDFEPQPMFVAEGVPNSSIKVPNNTIKVPNSTKKVPNSSIKVPNSTKKVPNNSKKVPNNSKKVPNNIFSKQRAIILQSVSTKGKITTKETEKLLSVKERRARAILTELVKEGILLKKGTTKNTIYLLKED